MGPRLDHPPEERPGPFRRTQPRCEPAVAAQGARIVVGSGAVLQVPKRLCGGAAAHDHIAEIDRPATGSLVSKHRCYTQKLCGRMLALSQLEISRGAQVNKSEGKVRRPKLVAQRGTSSALARRSSLSARTTVQGNHTAIVTLCTNPPNECSGVPGQRCLRRPMRQSPSGVLGHGRFLSLPPD